MEAQELELELDVSGRASIIDALTGRLLVDGLVCAYETADGSLYSIDESELNIRKAHYQEDTSQGEEILVETARGRNGLEVRWTLRLPDDLRGVLCRMEVANRSDEGANLRALLPLAVIDDACGFHLNLLDEVRCLACQPHSWRDTELYILDEKATSGLVTALADRTNRGFVAGFVSFDKYLGQFTIYEPETSGDTITLRSFHRFERGLTLEVGQTLVSEWVYLDCTKDVLSSLEDWAAFTGKRNHAVFATPKPSGFYTWYYYKECVSEDIVLKNARFLAQNRDRFPVNYVQMDSGWQRDYSCGETETTDNFPHGLAWLADRIRERGFVPGLWVNAFMCDYPTARLYKERPELFQKDEQGKPKPFGEPIRNVMGRDIPNMHTSIRPGKCYHIDSTSQPARDYLAERYRWVKSLGYGQVMLDFLDAGLPAEGATVADPSMTEIEALRGALQAVREALGDDVMILASGAYYLPVIGIANIVRTAGDICAHWKYVSRGCRQQLLQYFMHNRLFTAYADAMVLRDRPSPYWDSLADLSDFYLKLTLDEAQFYTAVTGMSGVAVWVAEDVAELAPERQWLLSLMLPIYDRGRFRPVDLFQHYYPRTLELKLSEGGREWVMAAGLNWQNLEVPVALRLEQIDLDAGATYHAFDVFRQEYLGQVAHSDTIGPANPRGVRLVNLVAVENRPQVVGTDLHITQGAIETARETWREAEGELVITLNDMEGRRGHLWVWVPEDRVLSTSADLATEFIPQDQGGVLKVPVALDGEQAMTLSFDRPRRM